MTTAHPEGLVTPVSMPRNSPISAILPLLLPGNLLSELPSYGNYGMKCKTAITLGVVGILV